MTKRFDDLDSNSEKETKVDQNHQSNHDSNDNNQSDSQLYFENKVDGKIELTEDAGYEATGFCFSNLKKWSILTVCTSF